MDLHDGTTTTAGRGATATVTRTRYGRRRPGGLFWPLLLLIPLLLALLATCAGHGGIQDDLRVRSLKALQDKGITGVGVVFHGRDGNLTVPAGADASAARETVAAVEGVRTVEVAGGSRAAAGSGSGDGSADATATAAPYSLSAQEGKVSVEAVVPTDKDKAALLDAVNAKVGAAQVIDKVTVKDGAQGPDADALAGLAVRIGRNPGAKAAFDGDQLTLSGEVPTQHVKTNLAADAEKLAPGKVQDLLVVKGAGTGSGADAAVCGRLDDALADVQKATKIQFSPASPALTPESHQAVSKIAALLRTCGDAKVEVGGYTDNQGDPATSQPLSEARAKAVRAELVKDGIDGSRISARGYGESHPIASNATAAGQAANRRVEIKVQ